MKSASQILVEAHAKGQATFYDTNRYGNVRTAVDAALKLVLNELYEERFKVLGSGNESTYIDSADILYLINELKQRSRYL